MELNSVYDILAFVLSFASILFQFCVIFVVVKVSPFTMRPYRYFLCIMTIWDISFTFLIGVGLAPHHVYPMSGATVHGFAQDFGLDFARVMVCAVVFSAVQIMAAEFYCLLYRLTVVFENRRIHKIFMHPISKTFAQIVFVCIGLFFSVPTFHLYLDKELICPVVFVILPTGVTLIFALSGYFTPQGFGVVLGHVFMLAICFYGTANSILTMFFVKPYRRYTKNLLLKLLCPFIKPKPRIADYDHTMNANPAMHLRNKAKLLLIIRY
ncbi:serpentine type 7TM GPCR chemoreceptor srh domain-containing protein [Ditylenchus destructor]|nr:serpentine type 7TM GPCR chemoreceptor srh domain-containing protein [Ditylenchus destructor]